MVKKTVPSLLLAVIGSIVFFSCSKSTKSTIDTTVNYFPIALGREVTYAVDSIVYNGDSCYQTETRTQLKYAITDTFRDGSNRLSYLMTVYSRPDASAVWGPLKTITMTVAGIPPVSTTPAADAPTTDLYYTQDRCQFTKLIFPIREGQSWAGNTAVNVADPQYAFLANWNYQYQSMGQSFNNGYINFGNTVTVLEQDQSINYPTIDSNVDASRTYAKEVYGYNVGMIYKEWTHWTYTAAHVGACINGYSVVMRAIDYH